MNGRTWRDRIKADLRGNLPNGGFVRRLCENVEKSLELRYRHIHQKLRVNEINDLADCGFWKSTIFVPNTKLNDVFTQPLRSADIHLPSKRVAHAAMR